jgi:hypothetical protein
VANAVVCDSVVIQRKFIVSFGASRYHHDLFSKAPSQPRQTAAKPNEKVAPINLRHSVFDRVSARFVFYPFRDCIHLVLHSERFVPIYTVYIITHFFQIFNDLGPAKAIVPILHLSGRMGAYTDIFFLTLEFEKAGSLYRWANLSIRQLETVASEFL